MAVTMSTAKNSRTEERSGHDVPLKQCGRISGKPEPSSMSKRHQPGVADQNVQRHARDCENDNFRGRRHREAEREQNRRQYQQADGGDDERESECG